MIGEQSKPNQPEKPRMVKVYWTARVHPEELPVYWQHAGSEVWWVLPVCTHWDDPIKRRSKREGGPTVVPCWQCPKTGPIPMREDAL